MFRSFRQGVAALFLFAATFASALQSYVAEYDLTIRSVGAGKVRQEAFFNELGYRIESVGNPSLAAKMLGYGQIREKAEGRIAGDRVTFRREMDGKENQFVYYNYGDVANGKVQAVIGSQNKELHVNPNEPALDMLALVVQSTLDVEHGRVGEHKYTLLNEDRVRSYEVKQQPDEIWKDGKSGKSIKIKVFVQTSGNRQTKIYFAENPLRLVKLQQLKDGESRFALKLLNYKTL